MVLPHTHQGAAGTAARWWGRALAALGAALVLLGTGVGSTGLESLWHLLWAQDASAAERALALQIVWDIRLPRTLGAWAARARPALARASVVGGKRANAGGRHLRKNKSTRTAACAPTR